MEIDLHPRGTLTKRVFHGKKTGHAGSSSVLSPKGRPAQGEGKNTTWGRGGDSTQKKKRGRRDETGPFAAKERNTLSEQRMPDLSSTGAGMA